MGHVSGQGLGKNQQGITTPVEAKLRKGKAAIGFYGSERVPSSLPQARVQEDSEEEEEKQFNQQLQQWRKDGEVREVLPYGVHGIACVCFVISLFALFFYILRLSFCQNNVCSTCLLKLFDQNHRS